MGTHVLSLPPWRGGEGGSELSNTQHDDEGQSQRAERGDDDLENIFDDDNCDEVNNNHGAEDAAAPRRVRETSRTSTRNSSGNGRERSKRGGRSSTSSSVATDTREEKEEGHQEPARQRRQKDRVALVAHENSELMSSAARLAGSRFLNGDGGGDTEDDVLSDCSSDDDLSCTSARAQSTGKGTVSQNGGRLRTEHSNCSRDETGAGEAGDPESNTEKTSDWRRHSSSPAARGGPRFDDHSGSGSSSGGGGRSVCFSEDRASGGRRISDASRSSHSGDDSAREPAGSGASTRADPGRRHSILKGNQGREDAVRRDSGNQTRPSTTQVASDTGRGDGVDVEPETSSRSNAVRAHQTGAVRTNLLSEEGNVTVVGLTETHKEAATSSAAPSRAEPLGEEPATGSRLAQASPSTTTHGGGSDMPAGRVLPKGSDPEPHHRGVLIVDGETGTSGVPTKAEAASNSYQEERDATLGEEATTNLVETSETVTTALSSMPAVPATAATGVVARTEAVPATKKEQHEEEVGSTTTKLCEQGRRVEDVGDPLLVPTPSLDLSGGNRLAAMSSEIAEPNTSPGESRCGGVSPGAAASSNAAENQARGGMVRDSVSIVDPKRVSTQQGASTTLMQGSSVNYAGVRTPGGGGGVPENDRVGRSAGMSLEVIVEAPGSGRGSDGGDAPAVAAAGASAIALDYSGSDNGGPIRKPYCLSPTNVVRQARGGAGATATAGSSCRERESLAARIQRLGDINAAATATAVNPAAQTCSVSESGFVALSGHSEGEGSGGGAAGGSPPSAGRMPTPPSSSHGGMSPERSRSCGLLIQDGDGGGSYCSSPSPSSRFHLPSSETKTAPLCSAGGSTSLFEGQVLRVDSEPVLRRAAERGSETKGMVAGTESRETDGMLSPPAGALRLDEEQLGVRV